MPEPVVVHRHNAMHEGIWPWKIAGVYYVYGRAATDIGQPPTSTRTSLSCQTRMRAIRFPC
jgi:hypothetical protein